MNKFLIVTLLLVLTFNLFGQERPQFNREALEMLSKGNFRGAIAVLDKDVAQNKNLFEAYKLRGSIKRMTGDFGGALSDFSSALELKSDDGELYQDRAMMRSYQRQDSSLILKDLDSAIVHGKKVEKVYTMRGTIKMQMQDIQGAIADFQTAVGLRPDLASPHLALSSAFHFAKDEDKAFEVLQNYITAFESSGEKKPKVRSRMTASSSNVVSSISSNDLTFGESSVILKGEPSISNKIPSPEEMDKMNESLEQSKNLSSIYSSLASIYEKRNNLEKASELVETALEIDPDGFTAYETRGKIKAKTGDYAGAIGDFSAFIKRVPQIPNVYLERGVAYLMDGKEAEAQKDFAKYLEIFPNGKPILDKRVGETKEKLRSQQ